MTENAPQTPPTTDARWLQPARVTQATIIGSLVIFAGLLFALLHPDSMPQTQEVFGGMAAKTGLPLWAVVVLVVGIAYLPFPFALWHLFRIVFRGASEGEVISKFGLVRAIFTVPSRHPDLRGSRWMVLLIFGGYLVAILIFAYLADERDMERKRNKAEVGLSCPTY